MLTILIFLGILAIVGVSFILGYSLSKINKKVQPKMDETERQKAERLKKEFNEVMNYNLNKALERRKL